MGSTLESLEQQRLARFLNSQVIASYIIIPGVALSLLQSFSCYEVDPHEVEDTGTKAQDTSYLRADLSVSCSGDSYRTGYYFSLCMCMVYLVILPSLHAFLLYRCRDLIQQRVALATVMHVADGQLSPDSKEHRKFTRQGNDRYKHGADHLIPEQDDEGHVVHTNDNPDDGLIDSHLHVTTRNIDLSHRMSVILARMEGREGSHQQDMKAYVDARKKYMATKDSGHSVFAYDVSHFLFLSYKPAFWYWEVVEMLRRLLLGAGLTAIYAGKSEQILLGMIVAGLFFTLQCFVRPYINDEANNLAKMGHQQYILSIWIALLIRTRSLEDDAEGLHYAKRSMGVVDSLDAMLVLINTLLVFNLLWYTLNREVILRLLEHPLKRMGLYSTLAGGKVTQDPASGENTNDSDTEAPPTLKAQSLVTKEKNISLVESAPSRSYRAAKLTEIDKYRGEKVGESSPRALLKRRKAENGEKLEHVADLDVSDGGNTVVNALRAFASSAESSVIFGPTFTMPFGETDLLSDITNYLGYLKARIAATYTLLMHEERAIAEIRRHGPLLESDDEVSTDPDTDEETPKTFIEKRALLRDFLERNSGILDEVATAMASEVCYEVEYEIADAFIVLPLMNLIHEVAVDGLLEMTPDPKKLWAEMHAGSYELHDELYAEQMAIMAAQKAEEERLEALEKARLEHEAAEAAAQAEKDGAIAEEEISCMHLEELETILYNKQKEKYDSEMETRKREKKIARKLARREEEAARKKEAEAEARRIAEEERLAAIAATPKPESPAEKKARLAREKKEKADQKKADEIRKATEKKLAMEKAKKEKEEQKKEKERQKRIKAEEAAKARAKKMEEEKQKRLEKKLLAEKAALKKQQLREENRKRAKLGLKPIKSMSELLPPKPATPEESSESEASEIKDTDTEGEATEPDDMNDEGVVIEVDEGDIAAEMARAKAELARKAAFREKAEAKQREIIKAEEDRLAELKRAEDAKKEEEMLELERQKRSREKRLETIDRLKSEIEEQRKQMAEAEEREKLAMTEAMRKTGDKVIKKSVISQGDAVEIQERKKKMARLQEDLDNLQEESKKADKKDIFQVVKFSAVRSHAAKMRERAAAAKAQREKDELTRRLKAIESEKQRRESAMSESERKARDEREEKKAKLKEKQRAAHEKRMAIAARTQERKLALERKQSMIVNLGKEETVDVDKKLSVAEVEDRNRSKKEKEKQKKEIEAEQHRIRIEAEKQKDKESKSSKLRERLRKRQSTRRLNLDGSESSDASESESSVSQEPEPPSEERQVLAEMKRQTDLAQQTRDIEAKANEEATKSNMKRRIEIKKRKKKVKKKFGSVIGRVKLMYKMGAFDSVDEEEEESGEDDDNEDDKKTETSMSSNVESDASNTPGFQPKLGAWGTDTKLAAAAGGIEVSDTESDVSGMSPRSPRFDISDESEADATP